jgi:hypothetical protein
MRNAPGAARIRVRRERREALEFFLDELATGVLEKFRIRFRYFTNFLIISK